MTDQGGRMNIPSDLPTIDRLIECLKPSNAGPGRMDRARGLADLVRQEQKRDAYRRSWRGQWERLWADRGRR